MNGTMDFHHRFKKSLMGSTSTVCVAVCVWLCVARIRVLSTHTRLWLWLWLSWPSAWHCSTLML